MKTMMTIRVTNETAPCWTDEVAMGSAPPAGRALTQDGEPSITTDDEATIAWARRHLTGGVEIVEVEPTKRQLMQMRQEQRRAVLRRILAAEPMGVRLGDVEDRGFAIDLMSQGFVTCDDEGSVWTIAAPAAARAEVES